MDLRNALLSLIDPECHGLPVNLNAAEVLNRVAQSDTGSLATDYECVRRAVTPSEPRLYPAGHLVKMEQGRAPARVGNSVVDELVVTPDMVLAHLPRRYVAAIVDADEQARQSGLSAPDLWAPFSALFF